MSRDGCRTWPDASVLAPGSAAYSDLAVSGNGHILCLYETDEYDRVTLARFDIAWIEAKA